MRILIISQWFDPEPTFKGLAFARELVGRGHEVEVLTGFPNYPGGELYPGYRIRPWQRTRIDDISVLRVPLYPNHGRSVIGRVANYGSFALSASIASAFVKRPDIIYVYHPPATIGLPAIIARLIRRAPVVYDIQDLWPDTVAATGMLTGSPVLRLIEGWCRFVYRTADRLVVLSPGFKTALTERGVPEAKIDVIYNWCDEASVSKSESLPVRLGKPGDFNVLFAGTMGFAQGLDAVLKAARICAKSVPNAHFIFVGGGADRERLARLAADMALSNVRFLPRQPMSEIGRFLSAADVLLVHLKDDPLFRITIPSKTQAYLAAGRPILMALRGDARDLIRRSGAGVVCEPEIPESIAAGVKELATAGAARREEMGRSGREFYHRELSISIGVERFERIFRAVLDGSGCIGSQSEPSTL
jgi:glycosyltransferase involved in cell wall biosynthesis